MRPNHQPQNWGIHLSSRTVYRLQTVFMPREPLRLKNVFICVHSCSFVANFRSLRRNFRPQIKPKAL